MDGRFGAILRRQGPGADDYDRRHPGPVAVSSAPALLRATGSGSRTGSAALATMEQSGVNDHHWIWAYSIRNAW
jgi:hypothetical protein